MEPAQRAGVPFGRYLIRRRLGKGGMGEVFLADQLGPLGPVRPVALKRMLPTLATDPGAVRAFLEEMGTAAQLNHPNIATTYDFGEVDGVYFLAMEFVDGLPLDRLLSRFGPVSPEVAVAIALAVLSALEVAHARRGGPVVHQDVSPHNVMLSRDGGVKLLDFGIARAEAQVRGGAIRAKIAYAAPEQLAGAPPDRRFDLFALGVTLYQTLTGARPYSATTAAEAQAATALGLYPRLAERRPEAQALEGVVARALEPDPAKRLPTAEAFRAALLRSGVTPAPPEVLRALVERGGPAPDDHAEITGTGVAALPREGTQELPGKTATTRPVAPPSPKRRPWVLPATAFVLGGTAALIWRLSVGPPPRPLPADPNGSPPVAQVITLDGGATEPVTASSTTPEAPPPVAAIVAEVNKPSADPSPNAAAPERRSRTRPRLVLQPAATPAPVAAPPPAPPPPPVAESPGGLGVLAVRTTPWAKVALDGQPLGDGIIAGKPVTAGKHRVTLTPGEGGYEARTIEIEVRPGGVTKLFADFGTGQFRVEAP